MILLQATLDPSRTVAQPENCLKIFVPHGVPFVRLLFRNVNLRGSDRIGMQIQDNGHGNRYIMPSYPNEDQIPENKLAMTFFTISLSWKKKLSPKYNTANIENIS